MNAKKIDISSLPMPLTSPSPLLFSQSDSSQARPLPLHLTQSVLIFIGDTPSMIMFSNHCIGKDISLYPCSTMPCRCKTKFRPLD